MKNKQVVRPKVTLNVYDFETKKPLENVVLTIKNSIESKSNKNGRLIVERKKDFLGNNHQIALIDSIFILNKNHYENVDINYIEYFNINLISEIKNSYVTDSIFIKKN